MGIYDREYYRDESESGGAGQYVPRTMVVRLILLNALLYLADMLFGGPRHSITSLLVLGSDDWSQPWKLWHLVSYAFGHNPFQIMHILGNMYGLWFFGRELEECYGKWEFLRIYLVGAVVGGVVWMLRTTWLGVPSQLLGASGAVMTLVVLYCLRFPDRRILLMMIIPVPAWVLGVLYVGQDLYAATSARSESNVAYDVHLVGAAFGFLYYQLDWNLGRFSFPLSSRLGRTSRRPSGSSWWTRLWRRRPSDHLKVYSPPPPPPSSSSKPADDLDERADAVLAKLHQFGDASLTPDERQVLEAYSRRLRQRRT
ncbi:MAG: rhomboid family intramembrane serine protease [Pirellulales bacterium]